LEGEPAHDLQAEEAAREARKIPSPEHVKQYEPDEIREDSE
jgi:hypothetical protein